MILMHNVKFLLKEESSRNVSFRPKNVTGARCEGYCKNLGRKMRLTEQSTFTGSKLGPRTELMYQRTDISVSKTII